MKNYPQSKFQVHVTHCEFEQMFGKNTKPTQSLPKYRRGRTLPNSFYKTSFFPVTKTRQKHQKKSIKKDINLEAKILH